MELAQPEIGYRPGIGCLPVYVRPHRHRGPARRRRHEHEHTLSGSAGHRIKSGAGADTRVLVAAPNGSHRSGSPTATSGEYASPKWLPAGGWLGPRWLPPPWLSLVLDDPAEQVAGPEDGSEAAQATGCQPEFHHVPTKRLPLTAEHDHQHCPEHHEQHRHSEP